MQMIMLRRTKTQLTNEQPRDFQPFSSNVMSYMISPITWYLKFNNLLGVKIQTTTYRCFRHKSLQVEDLMESSAKCL